MMSRAAAFVLAILLSPQSAYWDLSMDDVEMMARLLWGECRGVESTMEQAAVAWTVLNRVDDERFPDTIGAVIAQPHQFSGYSKRNPIDADLLVLSMDVILRWRLEHDGQAEVGRVIPSEYIYFVARNGRNYFGYEWPVSEVWDWSAEDPYAETDGEEIIDNDDGVDDLGSYGRAVDEARPQPRAIYRNRRRYDAGLVE